MISQSFFMMSRNALVSTPDKNKFEEEKVETAAKILVVDDEEDIRVFMKKYLEFEGYTVYEASDSRNILELCHTNQIQLMVTDILMAERDGLEGINQVHQKFPNIKILAISGGGKIKASLYLQMAKRLGASQVLEKPFAPKVFLQVVQQLLSS
jgi:CheY-like chemotaxis protein